MSCEGDIKMLSKRSEEPKKATCDQEVWVRDRILTAIRMAIRIDREARVGADEDIRSSAIRGVANGAAVEIIHTLGMKPSYVNLDECHSIEKAGYTKSYREQDPILPGGYNPSQQDKPVSSGYQPNPSCRSEKIVPPNPPRG